MKARLIAAIGLLLFFGSCNNDQQTNLKFTDRNRPVPNFNADSAYSFIVEQVEAGPRAPGSDGHQRTKSYLVNKLKTYAGNSYVFTQDFSHRGYGGATMEMANIIAAFNPASDDRIMLCAHWDTRPRADQDTLRVLEPILGADDGASGVAVLLEMARLFSKKKPPIGVDIVLFDGEDYGREGDISQYFIGSRFWSNYPPVENYSPRFAILLDMVGGKNAQFLREGFSEQFVPGLVREVWAIADQKGYESLFKPKDGARVSDDHVVINRVRDIPAIDIINHRVHENGNVKFPPYWHTHDDNLQIIDKATLEAVGEVLTELIYNRI